MLYCVCLPIRFVLQCWYFPIWRSLFCNKIIWGPYLFYLLTSWQCSVSNQQGLRSHEHIMLYPVSQNTPSKEFHVPWVYQEKVTITETPQDHSPFLSHSAEGRGSCPVAGDSHCIVHKVFTFTEHVWGPHTQCGGLPLVENVHMDTHLLVAPMAVPTARQSLKTW